MDEIAPEYDVVVLGTGAFAAYPAKQTRGGNELTWIHRSHRMRAFWVCVQPLFTEDTSGVINCIAVCSV